MLYALVPGHKHSKNNVGMMRKDSASFGEKKVAVIKIVVLSLL